MERGNLHFDIRFNSWDSFASLRSALSWTNFFYVSLRDILKGLCVGMPRQSLCTISMLIEKDSIVNQRTSYPISPELNAGFYIENFK